MIGIICSYSPLFMAVRKIKRTSPFSFPNEQLEMIGIIIEQDINHGNATYVFNNFILL